MLFKRFVLIAMAALVAPQVGRAAVTCPDRAVAPITKAAAGSLKCQEAIAKAGAKFLSAKVKTESKCRLKQPSGACLLPADVTKVEKSAAAAAASIAKSCGPDAAQAGLTSAYAGGTDDAVISSCMLSQHNVVGGLIAAQTNGPTTEPWVGTGPDRATCVKEISKQGTKFLSKALKSATKCLNSQAKLGTAGDLSPLCVGSVAGGAFVPPTDLKASTAQAKLITKAEDALTKKCGPAGTLGQIATLFACPGATTVADLQQCVVCGGLGGLFDAVEQEYAERGSFVANGPGAIQTAVSAAAPGDKLLIGSGTYQEEVNVTTADLAIVGCGGATNDRPKVIPTSPEVSGRGFRAASVDGLLFQSLDFFGQLNDHIFVGQANGVTFRDITGDGNRVTRYAVFPIVSNDVLVELCSVRNQSDAPIYVGQSSGIVVRFNDVREGVAAIEIENSGNAEVYGNYATGNTAGLLVFKDPSLPVQLSQCHDIHHNLLENNNEPNFGAGTVGNVPAGTGILVVSGDTTPYSYNLVRGNNTAGIVITSQELAFPPPPSESSVDGNYVFNNVFQNNGLDPDNQPPPSPPRWPFPDGYDVVFAPAASSGNCESGNVYGTSLFWDFSPPNSGTCVLPPPAVLPTCPAPPVGGSTTTTTTTTSTTTTT